MTTEQFIYKYILPFYNPSIFGFSLIQYLYFILAVFIIYNIKELRAFFKIHNKKVVYALILIILVGACFRLAMSPRNIFNNNYHGMAKIEEGFRDQLSQEGINLGMQIHSTDKELPSNYAYGFGYSEFINIINRIIPASYNLAFFITFLFSCFNILLLFILTKLFIKNEKVALISSFLLAILPVDIRYAFSDNTFIFQAAFFMMWLINIIIMINKSTDTKYFISLLIITQILMYCYPVSVFLPLLFIIIALVYRIKIKEYLKNKYALLSLGIFFVFSLPVYAIGPLLRAGFQSHLQPFLHRSIELYFSEIHVFFNTYVTPLWYILFFLIGVIFAIKDGRYKKVFINIFTIAFLLMPVFYGHPLESCHDYLLFWEAYIQFLYLPLTAYGIYKIISIVPIRYKNIIIIIFIVVGLITPHIYSGMINKLYDEQEEYEFVVNNKAYLASIKGSLYSFSYVLEAINKIDNCISERFIIMPRLDYSKKEKASDEDNRRKRKKINRHIDDIKRLIRDKKTVIFYQSTDDYKYHHYERETGQEYAMLKLRPEVIYFKYYFRFIPLKVKQITSEVLLPIEHYTNVDELEIGFYKIEEK